MPNSFQHLFDIKFIGILNQVQDDVDNSGMVHYLFAIIGCMWYNRANSGVKRGASMKTIDMTAFSGGGGLLSAS
jgi:hypothetical protein